MSEQFNQWLKDASEGTIPKLEQSGAYAGIVTTAFLNDPLCALQLGYAILLNKPILLIADREVTLPESLVKIAKRIERIDIKNKADMQRASTSISEFMRSL